jgi:hypothetical protein
MGTRVNLDLGMIVDAVVMLVDGCQFIVPIFGEEKPVPEQL